jgi:pyrimidine operon attenuation protein/uracil phosphoribosyltransferase
MQEVILESQDFYSLVDQLAEAILEKHKDFSNVALVGIQQGGVVVSDALFASLQNKLTTPAPAYGNIDITFYRDDLHHKILQPDIMSLPFDVNNRHIILVDDVLYTGRTIKAGLDVLLDYGRPAKVELCVLIDRTEHRQFPIRADYVGMTNDAPAQEKLKLIKGEGKDVRVVKISS